MSKKKSIIYTYNKRILVMSILFSLFINILPFVNISFANEDTMLTDSKNYQPTIEELKSPTIQNLYNVDSSNIPSSYDLRDYIDIKTEDQQNTELCMLFSIIKSLETNVAITKGVNYDFSERYIDYMTSKYFYGNREVGILVNEENNWTGTAGYGESYGEVITYLEMYGAALECEVPFKNYTESELDIIKDATLIKRVTSTISFPSLYDCTTEEELEDARNIIKTHIKKYGSISTTIGVPCSANYNYDTYALFTGESVDGLPGHEVSIVGWDDAYPKENFGSTTGKQPKNDGAYIALNSYGTNFGDNGYFYISYEDIDVERQMHGILDTEDVIENKEYTHAENLITRSGQGSTNKFYATTFEKENDIEYLQYISVLAYPKSKCKIYVNPKNDDITAVDDYVYVGETNSVSGCCMILNLDNPIEITGDKFTIAMEIISENNTVVVCQDKDDQTIWGNTYRAESLSGEWSLAPDVPIFAYTTENEDFLDLNISYSNRNITNENVIVTISSEQELEEVNGWTISDDKKTLEKEYEKNTEELFEFVTVKSSNGKQRKVAINVSNIDKDPPKYEIIYDYIDENTVDVIINLDEPIQAVDGWYYDEDKLRLIKGFLGGANHSEYVTLTDMLGNSESVLIEVKFNNSDDGGDDTPPKDDDDGNSDPVPPTDDDERENPTPVPPTDDDGGETEPTPIPPTDDDGGEVNPTPIPLTDDDGGEVNPTPIPLTDDYGGEIINNPIDNKDKDTLKEKSNPVDKQDNSKSQSVLPQTGEKLRNMVVIPILIILVAFTISRIKKIFEN